MSILICNTEKNLLIDFLKQHLITDEPHIIMCSLIFCSVTLLKGVKSKECDQRLLVLL